MTDFNHATGRRPVPVVRRAESKHPMNKRQLIDEIRRFNTAVQPQFLAQFDQAALRQYLGHLQAAARKHVQISGWVRREPKLRMAS